MDIVNNAIQTQTLDRNSLSYLMASLLDYVRQIYGCQSQEPPDQPALQNKLTQTLTYLFVYS